MRKILAVNDQPLPNEKGNDTGGKGGDVQESEEKTETQKDYPGGNEEDVPGPAGPDNKTTSSQIKSLLGF